jgi:hypothetical protein
MYLSKEFVLAPYIGLHGVMLDWAQEQLYTTLATRHFAVGYHIIVICRPSCRSGLNMSREFEEVFEYINITD